MKYYEAAIKLADAMIDLFADEEGGAFFDTPAAGIGGAPIGALSARRKPLQDSPTPAGNPTAASALLRLEELSGNKQYREVAADTLGCKGVLTLWAVCGKLWTGCGTDAARSGAACGCWGRKEAIGCCARLNRLLLQLGKTAMDELHQQTVNLLNFQGLPAAFTTRRPRQSAWRNGRRGQTQSLDRGGSYSTPL